MILIQPRYPRVTFGSLFAGDVFEADGGLFIKTDMTDGSSVCLKTGELSKFNQGEFVEDLSDIVWEGREQND